MNRLAKLLRKAAKKHLSSGVKDPWNESLTKKHFSCDAVLAACPKRHRGVGRYYDVNVVAFLESLGCHCNRVTEFDQFEAGPERQGARYAWLMFAALIAEEEGIK
jgi:hypothetical protein